MSRQKLSVYIKEKASFYYLFHGEIVKVDTTTDEEITILVDHSYRGFVVDEQWNKGTLRSATIRSTIGGKLRLRSYVPLQGKGLVKASGNCPNRLMAPADVKHPLCSKELKSFEQLSVRPVYEYDLDTRSGGVYTVRTK